MRRKNAPERLYRGLGGKSHGSAYNSSVRHYGAKGIAVRRSEWYFHPDSKGIPRFPYKWSQTTHVAKLLVGPLAEGATNLVESDCNVYSITINRTVGINELIVQDSDGSTATLAPAFHPQEKEYETEVKGEKIKVKTAWVEPIKTYVGNNTEPANSGTTGFAWTDVELADYTANMVFSYYCLFQ